MTRDRSRRSPRGRRLAGVVAVLLIAAASAAFAAEPVEAEASVAARQDAQASDPFGPSAAPEAPSGFVPQATARGSTLMAATANPLATDAAYAVLAAGGTAVDAVVAAQMMLSLVEPQSSGIGGGAFMLTYTARSGRVAAWDGRETAPMGADERLFLDGTGRPVPFFAAVVGGRAVGVPGVVRMLETAHRQLGRTPWPELFQPAIDRATSGFEIGRRLHTLISADRFLADDPAARAYFYDVDGRPRAAGSRLRNPALARTLELLAREGSRSLHSGALAGEIVSKVRGHPRNPGLLTLADLAAYEVRLREPVCSPWLRWIVCGMPPPSAGGIAVAQMLGILEALPFGGLTRGTSSLDPTGIHLFTEAGRLAYADRDRHLSDGDFVAIPPGLTERDYLQQRASRVGPRSMRTAEVGWPSADYPEGGTSHVSVVDQEGNAAALTSSIENAFGSRQMVGGFLLNNQLTDFSFAPHQPRSEDGGPPPSAGTAAASRPANRVQPGKRPRSSMAPTLVFERRSGPGAASAPGVPAGPGGAAAPGGAAGAAGAAGPSGRAGPDGTVDTSGTAATAARSSDARGRLVMVTGSPGGASIINYVAKTLVATLQDGLPPQDAIALPNIGSRNGPTELERGRVAPEVVKWLKAHGHEIRETDATSGVQSIVWRCGEEAGSCAWEGAADPRREGTARGR